MRHNAYRQSKRSIPIPQLSALFACAVLLTGCAGGCALCIALAVIGSNGEVGSGALDANVKPAVTPGFTFKDSDPFSYMNWGPWGGKNLGSSTTTFGYAVGQATPPSAMPQSGSAFYAGRALATYPLGGSVEGTVTLNANFSKSTIDVNIFHADGHTLTYSGGVISQNGYENNGVNRSLFGKFFGPNAQETSGTYVWSSPSYSVNGSYGARLCSPGVTVC
jgi:hypothetical protein